MVKEKTTTTSFRIKKSELRQLEREAKYEFMTLAGYLRKLVITHPGRNNGTPRKIFIDPK